MKRSFFSFACLPVCLPACRPACLLHLTAGCLASSFSFYWLSIRLQQRWIRTPDFGEKYAYTSLAFCVTPWTPITCAIFNIVFRTFVKNSLLGFSIVQICTYYISGLFNQSIPSGAQWVLRKRQKGGKNRNIKSIQPALSTYTHYRTYPRTTGIARVVSLNVIHAGTINV